ncbi:uncharacterized protein RCH25_049056 [Pelodytes ibericus]
MESVMESVRENLSFEGFLRKRKDRMKFTWARYWFKLQNTTLYFYITQESQAPMLRGQYYMYYVQSVRKVISPEEDFLFEIVMKNGKRKLLSADTAQLRDVWMEFLWKAMQLPGPGRDRSSCTWYDIPDLLQKANPECDDGSHDKLIKGRVQGGKSTNQPPLSPKQTYNYRKTESYISEDIDDIYGFPTNNLLPMPSTNAGDESDDSLDANIYDIPRSIKDQPVAESGVRDMVATVKDSDNSNLSQEDNQTS